MKKLLYISALTFLVSCSQSKESMLSGKWVLSEASCANLEAFAKSRETLALANIEQNISQTKRYIEIAKDENEKTRLASRISELEKSKQNVSASVKEEIEGIFHSAKGNMTYSFDENGGFSVSYDADNMKGSFKYRSDTLTVILDNQEADKFAVTKLTPSELVLNTIQEENTRDVPMKMVLSFKKK